MLAQLSVRNFAIVEHAELEFASGMTTLTGETGAGKSILIDALSAALGQRASSSVVREGCDRADVTAVFDIADNADALAWLSEQDLNDNTFECILRRTIAHDGRSRAYINARPVPVGVLSEIGQRIVDIHGQNTHQSLLRAPVQRALLDDYAQNEPLCVALLTAYRDWRHASDELENIEGPAADTDSKLALLKYQFDELQALDLQPGELKLLESELSTLSKVDDLIAGENLVLHRLDSDSEQTILAILEQCVHDLRQYGEDDPATRDIVELLSVASIQVREALADLRQHVESLEPSPERLAEINTRLSTISDLARKHHVSAEQLEETFSDIGIAIAEIEGRHERVVQLREKIAQEFATYAKCAQALTEARHATAPKLERGISEQLQTLGMKGAQLQVVVHNDASRGPSPNGNDRVEFLVSTNPGQSPLPLAKIASGGELSRISLALQLVTIDGTGVPTVIFDEVDAGVGGEVAQTIGKQMHELAMRRQVLCVTHLPQVASQSDNHVLVSKSTEPQETGTHFTTLGHDQRVEEIARMLSGSKLTEQSRAHAEEMLDEAATESP